MFPARALEKTKKAPKREINDNLDLSVSKPVRAAYWGFAI
jgi:hypothetical protein